MALECEKKTYAGKTCPDCGEIYLLKVCQSFSGYYIGTECQCGPNSRESLYYPTSDLAQEALDSGNFGR
jgi:predicted RNA-binding Zn-ribbon protein involved in translation (DUF1610 family)